MFIYMCILAYILMDTKTFLESSSLFGKAPVLMPFLCVRLVSGWQATGTGIQVRLRQTCLSHLLSGSTVGIFYVTDLAVCVYMVRWLLCVISGA